jgi:hypothetical protein
MSSTTTAVVTKKPGTFFERYSWVVFVALGLIITLFGLGDMMTGGATFEGGEAPTVQGISGMTWQQLSSASPDAANMIDYLVRAGGINLFLLGLLSAVVAATAFRRGERWAWFAMWLWPLWLAMIVLLLLSAYKQPGPGVPPPLVSGSIFLVITVLTLALSFRKFFPKRQAAVGATVGG